MSRIGKLPITLPKGVTLKVDDNMVSIKGPLGELSRQIPPEILCCRRRKSNCYS